MKIAVAYFVGTHRYSFRPDQPAEIVGVKMVRPDRLGAEPRPCFELRWPDGFIDYSPIDDPGTYRIESKVDWENVR